MKSNSPKLQMQTLILCYQKHTLFYLRLSFIIKSQWNKIVLRTIPCLAQGLHLDGYWIQEVPWRGWSKERQGKWSCCFFPEIGEGQEVSAVEQVSPVPFFILTVPHAKTSIEQQGNWWKWPFERVCEKGPVFS